ncbi:MAG: hypothetical protein GTO55_08115 [Armatimonadetes bacterium]|nr:hypothetical protein [Armatimonadota bacterium]NIM24217.1 hypothetical protein [Armatimonadota bacterium]NIM68086.1 hypothetical protein [Armatimonadota bacterium]NIM76548.1 hypothetical protein [Armatimonadota bacterium]NIN06291.1 hypothetical protein [Armatimonadota bacterium]
MKTIVDIPENLFRKARYYIDDGRYSSLGEAIVIALETQFALEEIGEGKAVDASEVRRSTGKTRVRHARGLGNRDRRSSADSEVSDSRSLPAEVKPVSAGKIARVPMPTLEKVGKRPYWLWGVHRIAPVKVAARIAASLILDARGSVRLEDLREKGGQIAFEVGEYLVAQDNQKGRKHGSRLSSGFPCSHLKDPDNRRSISRFADLILGDVRKKTGRVDGALYELRLLEVSEGKGESHIVSLTEPGMEFAMLHSPILDGESPESSLSEEEIEWYLRHIRENVPWEYDTLSKAIGYIGNGYGDTQGFLNAMVENYGHMSEKTRASLRVCMLGRLLDLRLIARIDKGEYTLTGRDL